MDPRKFDEAVRRFAEGVSRRSIVGGSVGASVGSALAAVGLSEDAEAKKGKGKNKDGRKGKKNRGGNKGDGDNDNRDRRNDDDQDDDISLERKKGKGGRCRRDKNCLSRFCQGGKKKKRKGRGRCGASEIGKRCRSDSDCVSNAPCIDGLCNFPS